MGDKFSMDEIKQALSSIRDVVAVGLGGSRGLSIASENSDYDFVLFHYGGERIPAPLIVDAIKPFTGVEDIQDGAGFVRSQVAGKKIDIFQKDLSLVEKEIAMAKLGKFRWVIRQLFPHGDLSTCLISHIMYLELCSEKNQSVSTLRNLASPFPFLLMSSLIKTFLTQASITIIHASKIKTTTDVQYLIALCSSFVFFANIVIFTINKVYPIVEKGGAKIIAGLPLQPQNYDQRISGIFRAAIEMDTKLVLSELSAVQNELSVLASQVLENRKTLLTNEST